MASLYVIGRILYLIMIKMKILNFQKNLLQKIFLTQKKLHWYKIFFDKGNLFTFKVQPKKSYVSIINKISKHNLCKKIAFLNKKYKKVCSFQTRNIPHSGHEAIKYLLKSFDHVVVNPVIGPKEDIKLQTLQKVYKKLINDKYKNKVSFAYLF